jgi:hypothetical protein
MPIRKLRWLLLSLLMPLLAGCAGAANVSGSVTYGGNAVERGKIRFLPVDDKGDLDPKAEIIGVDVANGKYAAKDVPMGKKKVAIDAQQIAGHATTRPTDEKTMAKQAIEPLIPPEVTRDLNADINSANQTLDFNLQKPSPSSGDAGKK